MINDNDLNDYVEEEGQLRRQRKIERMIVNRDPYYPPEYHREDVLGRLGIKEGRFDD
ncbi:hypothetical protein [Gordoniibacillus kamchatkensis]|uniref:hypothetical protein n=1 Tax=Gordoniibacillus kamchatkensis TaxID=1590651 RepID=UPI0012DFEB06|nr:hypothetical protein [Paenibacillus sp. VKM B-2647]